MTAPTAAREGARRWFLKEPSPAAEYRLFLFPYSGCGASMYRAWPDTLGPVDVLPLQLPWRENRMREKHFGDYESLADQAVEDLAALLDRPYGIFGHCGGALPAFETALRIEERGLRPADRLFVSSQVAPQDGPYGRFLGMSGPELREELLTLLAAMGAQDPAPDLVDMVLEVLEADLEANKAYHREVSRRLEAPFTSIGWDADVEVPHELMTGWDAWSSAESVVFPGTHYTFLEAPLVLQERLRQDLTGS